MNRVRILPQKRQNFVKKVKNDVNEVRVKACTSKVKIVVDWMDGRLTELTTVNSELPKTGANHKLT